MSGLVKDNELLNGLRVEIHGHAGVDIAGMEEVTSFVSSIQITHAVNPPWDTMTITLRIPHHLLDLLLTGDQNNNGRARIHTGGWVVVRLNGAATGDPKTGNPAIGFGCIETISFGFQDISGVGRSSVQGTAPVVLQCSSWFTSAGRSNIRLAITDDETSRGGVQDATTWFPVITEAIKNSTSHDLGYALTQLWKMTAQVDVPDTLLSLNQSFSRSFGNVVPVVYNSTEADKYAPDRNTSTLPVRGQGFLNLPVIQPECSLWQWLGAVFVPDSNVVELFPSLEYPHLLATGENKYVPVDIPTAAEGMRADSNVSGSLSGSNDTEGTLQPRATDPDGKSVDPYNAEGVSRNHLTTLGKALGGANVVLVYRYKPFLLHPINKANWGYTTKSEQLKVNQEYVRPTHFGSAAVWYTVQDYEALSMQVTFSEADRVNLTFARPTMVQTGALRPYSQFGKVCKPRERDFVHYGLRAYEPMWPYLPEGTAVDLTAAQGYVAASQNMSGTATAPSGLLDDLEAMGELIWALCGSAERFAHATLNTRVKPLCRAGHWMSGSLGYVASSESKLQHWTGYIESVTHFFEVDAQARWHSGSTFTLSRVSFSTGSSRYFTPVVSDDKAMAGSDIKTSKKSRAKEPKPTKKKWSPPQQAKEGAASPAPPAVSDNAKMNLILSRAQVLVDTRKDMTYQRGYGDKAKDWAVGGKTDCSSLLWYILGQFRRGRNTDVIWMMANSNKGVFRKLSGPVAGAIGVYGESDKVSPKTKDNVREWSGHVFLVANPDLKNFEIIDCSRTGPNDPGGIRRRKSTYHSHGPTDGRTRSLIFVEYVGDVPPLGVYPS